MFFSCCSPATDEKLCVRDSGTNICAVTTEKLSEHLKTAEQMLGIQYPGQPLTPVEVACSSEIFTSFARHRGEPDG